MNKIRLELDALAVESFETASLSGGEGTVLAHGRSRLDACPSARGCTEIGDCYTDVCATMDAACETLDPAEKTC